MITLLLRINGLDGAAVPGQTPSKTLISLLEIEMPPMLRAPLVLIPDISSNESRTRAFDATAEPSVMPMTYDGGGRTDEPLTVRLLQLRAPIPLILPPDPGTRAKPSVAIPRVIPERKLSL
ncbi:unnamed protein product [Phytophthora fragariaefolia]|uniref:Unnamed protein product n=1 Tax=Phytophthora fragariaefolia TaxID=1490495 RepID=A0A9W6U6P7_9STRA|nr:unnamed protein product [Phytophthora fragariaefolia]